MHPIDAEHNCQAQYCASAQHASMHITRLIIHQCYVPCWFMQPKIMQTLVAGAPLLQKLDLEVVLCCAAKEGINEASNAVHELHAHRSVLQKSLSCRHPQQSADCLSRGATPPCTAKLCARGIWQCKC